MALNSGTSAGSRGPQIVYYRGPRIVVTNHFIENATGRYAVRDIGTVRRVHEIAYPAYKVALISGALELAIAAPVAVLYGSAIMWGAGTVTAFGVGAALIADGRRNPRWMALRAVHRGEMVELFSSRRHQEFEQVRRAVIRAIEANERPHP